MSISFRASTGHKYPARCRKAQCTEYIWRQCSNHGNLFPSPLVSIVIPVFPIPMSSTVAHKIPLVHLVVGLGTAWIATFLIAKLISLRSALNSLGWGCLLFVAIERGWWWFFTKRNCPGNGVLLLHPFRSAAMIAGTIFPFKGMIGSYFGKFSRVYSVARSLDLNNWTTFACRI